MAMVAEIGSLAVRIPPDPAGLATSRHVGRDFHRRGWVSRQALRRSLAVTSMRIAERGGQAPESGSSNGHLYPVSSSSYYACSLSLSPPSSSSSS